MKRRLTTEEEREWRNARARIRRVERRRKANGKKKRDDTEGQKSRRLKRNKLRFIEKELRRKRRKKRCGLIKIGEDGYRNCGDMSFKCEC